MPRSGGRYVRHGGKPVLVERTGWKPSAEEKKAAEKALAAAQKAQDGADSDSKGEAKASSGGGK